ncbi:MAG: hypothetical protein LBQ47_05010 [Endomicrobium sp.]|jgi:hypothetical protein|nr:hypothetical protein [Endomicrobium sp.]
MNVKIKEAAGLVCAVCLLICGLRTVLFASAAESGLKASLDGAPANYFDSPYAKVMYFANHSSDLLVINIMDFCGDYNSQIAVSRLLENIEASGKEVEIYVEGAYEKVDLSYLKELSGKPFFNALSAAFLKGGQITGAESFALRKPGRILLPLEDKNVYLKNFRDNSVLLKDRQNILRAAEKYFSAAEKSLNALFGHDGSVFKSGLFKYKKEYENGRIKRDLFEKKIVGYAVKFGIDIDYKNLYPNFYNSASASGNFNELFLKTEEENIVWEILKRRASSAAESIAIEHGRILSRVKKLLQGVISSYEYESLVKDNPDINSLFKRYAGAKLPDEILNFYNLSKEFYAVNSARNKIFIEKAGIPFFYGTQSGKSGSMSESFSKASKIKVLISQSYHCQGLSELLNERKVSNIAISPKYISGAGQSKRMRPQLLEDFSVLAAQKALNPEALIVKNGDLVLPELCSEALGYETLAFFNSLSRRAKDEALNAYLAALIKKVNSLVLADNKIKSLNITFVDKTFTSYIIMVRVQKENGQTLEQIYESYKTSGDSQFKIAQSLQKFLSFFKFPQKSAYLYYESLKNIEYVSKKIEAFVLFFSGGAGFDDYELLAPEIKNSLTVLFYNSSLALKNAKQEDKELSKELAGKIKRVCAQSFRLVNEGFGKVKNLYGIYCAANNLNKLLKSNKIEIPEKLSAWKSGYYYDGKKAYRRILPYVEKYVSNVSVKDSPIFAFAAEGFKVLGASGKDANLEDEVFLAIKDRYFKKVFAKQGMKAAAALQYLNVQTLEALNFLPQTGVKSAREKHSALIRSLIALQTVAQYAPAYNVEEIILNANAVFASNCSPENFWFKNIYENAFIKAAADTGLRDVSQDKIYRDMAGDFLISVAEDISLNLQIRRQAILRLKDFNNGKTQAALSSIKTPELILYAEPVLFDLKRRQAKDLIFSDLNLYLEKFLTASAYEKEIYGAAALDVLFSAQANKNIKSGLVKKLKEMPEEFLRLFKKVPGFFAQASGAADGALSYNAFVISNEENAAAAARGLKLRGFEPLVLVNRENLGKKDFYFAGFSESGLYPVFFESILAPNIVKTRLAGAAEFFGSGYFSEVFSNFITGSERNFWRPEKSGFAFNTLPLSASLIESVKKADIIFAGLCDFTVDLAPWLSFPDLSSALSSNKKAVKVLISNPFNDGGSVTVWKYLAVDFIENVSGMRFEKLFNRVVSWSSGNKDYKNFNGISFSGLKTLKERKVSFQLFDYGDAQNAVLHLPDKNVSEKEFEFVPLSKKEAARLWTLGIIRSFEEYKYIQAPENFDIFFKTVKRGNKIFTKCFYVCSPAADPSKNEDTLRQWLKKESPYLLWNKLL